MYKFWSKYHLPMGNLNLPKNHSETSYFLNKLNVLFKMPVNDTIANRQMGHNVQVYGYWFSSEALQLGVGLNKFGLGTHSGSEELLWFFLNTRKSYLSSTNTCSINQPIKPKSSVCWLQARSAEVTFIFFLGEQPVGHENRNWTRLMQSK